MAASLIVPSSGGRISQLLPSVKCSSCNQPVPLNQLTDHVCLRPPPVPALPQPGFSPAAAAALLPQRLQGRVPASPILSLDLRVGSAPLPQDSPQPRTATPPVERLRIKTSFAVQPNQRSSPLARPDSRLDPELSNTSSPIDFPELPSPPSAPLLLPRRTPPPSAVSTSPLRVRAISNASSARSGGLPSPPPQLPLPAPPSTSLQPPPPLLADPRQRAMSSATPVTGNEIPSPTIYARPPPRSATTPTPGAFPPRTASNIGPSPFSNPSPYDSVPFLSESEIDTKSGGEAGMAGVGRRGFAAAARAAMLASSLGSQPINRPPPPAVRRDNVPMYLNVNLPPRSVDTPPLSASSGYSTSPGLSPFPQSPLGPPPSSSHDHYGVKPSPITSHQPDTINPLLVDAPTLPPGNMPYPGPVGPNDDEFDSLPSPTFLPNDAETPSTAKQPQLMSPKRGSTSEYSDSEYSVNHPSRSNSTSTRADTIKRPMTPLSDPESDFEGLAYADSTTDVDDAEITSRESRRISKGKANPPPPLPLNSILRSDSTASSTLQRFPSTSDRSGRSGIRLASGGAGHRRDASTSSMSSASSTTSSHAAAIAQALGLNQRTPSEYGRLGGPGTGRGKGRSTSGSSSSGRSGYSRGRPDSNASNGAGKPGRMEQEMETLLEGATTGGSQDDEPQRVGLTKSKSTGKQRSFSRGGNGTESGDGMKGAGAGMNGKAGPLGAQRSNTVQGIHLSDGNKSPKLPARARTSVMRTPDAKEGRPKKDKLCLKCETKIENGRWVRVDNGGVLCESCWKNMYLPKCRRCNEPIEKQAVSSSDGQLKGKYHRECFNCNVCHKPFPDKSFYVFDGKPLCAYHYHEANRSLCAAADCGQPIEGPCAVSHTGDRYHPEHMTCEYPRGSPCMTRLDAYWEVDGRMLCEEHAHASSGEDEWDESHESEWNPNSKARKRVTRFIDLSESLR